MGHTSRLTIEELTVCMPSGKGFIQGFKYFQNNKKVGQGAGSRKGLQE